MPANNIVTLTGGQLGIAHAINNTQTDRFTVLGADNTIFGSAGNLIVNGFDSATFGLDTGTIIDLNAASGVNDAIHLNGSGNALIGLHPLSNSTIRFAVNGTGSSGGGNTASLVNTGGTTTVLLRGAGNTVTLNGDATNTVNSGAGGAQVTIGTEDDNSFGFATSIKVGASGNTVFGGDENFSVAGGVNANNIILGDGENTVGVTGINNHITVGGGDNTINAGGSGAVVNITGVDHDNAPVFTPDLGDSSVPAHPMDDVTIAGAGDVVNWTYENVAVSGLGVTGSATITGGDGNNVVVLRGSGGNVITLGDGGNGVSVTGSNNIINLGDGANGITLRGNNNIVNITDATGTGLDIFKLGAGQGDVLHLDHAAAIITGVATGGLTTITQTGPNDVLIDIGASVGAIILGDGDNHVNANGAQTSISAGDGNNTVTANGANTTVALGNGGNNVTANGFETSVTVGNGNNTVNANGDDASVTAGNGNNTISANGDQASVTAGWGNNTVNANGDGASVTVGNGNNTLNANGDGSSVVAGSGNNTISATGSDTSVTVAANASSVDKVTLGDNDSLNISGGTDTITLLGAGDTVVGNALNPGSQITVLGNGDTVKLGSDSSAWIHFNPSSSGETILVQADVGGTDHGVVNVDNFGPGDLLDLQGFGNLQSFADVLSNMTFGAVQDTLALPGGGSINFDANTIFASNEFLFSNSQGPVT